MDTRPRVPFRLVVACLGLGVVYIVHPAAASAQLWSGTAAWSAPGATGVVDESNTTIVAFDTPAVGQQASAPASAVAVLRCLSSGPAAAVVDPSVAHTSIAW